MVIHVHGSYQKGLSKVCLLIPHISFPAFSLISPALSPPLTRLFFVFSRRLIHLASFTTYASIISPVFKVHLFSGVSSDYSSPLPSVPLMHVVGFHSATSISSLGFQRPRRFKKTGSCQCYFSSSTGINSNRFQFQIKAFRKRVVLLRSSL